MVDRKVLMLMMLLMLRKKNSITNINVIPYNNAWRSEKRMKLFRRRQSRQRLLFLRPYTWGKHFLLFLPDSHSAYYDSFVSALGRSLPPSLGLSRICCTWSSFWRKRRVGRGGWVVGSPTRACNTW